MSLLIKGIDMPTDGRLFAIVIDSATGEIMRPSGDGSWAVVDGAKAVPVPSHGRLIDELWLKRAMVETLEALKRNPKMDRQEMHLIAAFDTLRAMIEDAPTIIEAEKGEE